VSLQCMHVLERAKLDHSQHGNTMNQGMKKRHHGGGMNNNRKAGGMRYGKPNGEGGGNFYPQRPRKNHAQAREKYLNQAKDALAMGDRVLAEYYFQHAEHHYRMQQEFLENRNRWREQNPVQAASEPQDTDEVSMESDPADDMPTSTTALPAFLTRKVEQRTDADNDAEAKVPVTQEWEE
jgi:hypothetical protein